MTAYVVVHAKTKDQEKLGVYAKAAGQTLTAHGGKFWLALRFWRP